MIVSFPVHIQAEWKVEFCLNEYSHQIKSTILSFQTRQATLAMNHAIPMKKVGIFYWELILVDGSAVVTHLLSDDVVKINSLVCSFLNGRG